MILDKRTTKVPSPVSQPIVDGKTKCTKCSKEKPVEDFYKAPHIKRGRFPHCKSCCKEKNDRISAEKRFYKNMFI